MRIMRSKDVKLIPLKAFPHRSILQNYDLVHLRQEANAMCHQNPLSIKVLQYSFLNMGRQFSPLSNIVIALSSGIS